MMEVSNVTIDGIFMTIDAVCIKPIGGIDLDGAEELERTINSVLSSQCYRIVLDLSAVYHIGSCGWGVILSKLKNIRTNNGDLKLVGMQADVYDFYKTLEFFWVLRAYHTLEQALHDFAHSVAPMPES